jgi:hypothetical protein
MVAVGIIGPVRWPLQALEGALWRGCINGQVLLPCAVFVGLGVLGFAVGSRVLDWSGVKKPD